jgi:sulfur relay (sulfurtransferase) complex TusBCD TusD component (DsrE family)
LTIFLNDKGVLVGARSNASRYAEHQKSLAELMSKGTTVLICPMCMKHYGVTQSDLLPGIKVGSPDVTGGALFKDGSRTLTW